MARRRYITRALIKRYGPTEDCGACFRKSQQHTERCRARCDLLCAGEGGPVEARAQEVQPAPPDPAAPSLISTSTASQTGGVDTDLMESEDIEPAVSSRAHATAAPIRPCVTGGDETMQQDGPESKRQRIVAVLPVCSLLTPGDEILVSYVATHEIDDRPVYDHKTGERLSPHLVKFGRQTEHDAMTRHQLFERVPFAMARGKKVRCQWLDEMKEGPRGPFVRSRLVPMEVAHGVRFETFAGTAPLKSIKMMISRAASIKNTRGEHSRVLALYDIIVCVLACTIARRRADCDVSAAW